MREKKGIITIMILNMLKEAEASGYDIIKHCSEILGRKVSSGTVYPALKGLRETGYIIGKNVGRRKVYSLTEMGKKRVREVEHLKEEYIHWMEGLGRALGEVFNMEDIKNIDKRMRVHFYTADVLMPIGKLIEDLKEKGVQDKKIRDIVKRAERDLKHLA